MIPNRKGEYLASHRFPLWLVELPRIVEEDRTNCRLHKGRACINIATNTFKIQPYLDSCLREPGKSHEDLLLLVQVAAGDREDNPEHSEDKSCEENCETPAG